jgi:predicted glycosyltransferase
VEDYRGLNILIISGSPIAGAFDYRARVDFVKIPSVIKLRNGEYTSLDRHIDLHETLQMRQSIIRYTAETFQPDLFIVDKEPMGLGGELEETLSYLKTRATTLVLGLREVMDAPRLLDAEWKRRDVMRKIDLFYDQIWVYGPSDFYDPLRELEVPATVRSRMSFVGFLPRHVLASQLPSHRPDSDYILVTTGGGGDGAELVHNVLDSYQQDASLQHRALIVLGPYMPARKRRKLFKKGKKCPWVKIIEFDSHMENLIAEAKGVVAMCGYNTFCEILSFDKPAVIVPRVRPREEQLIRAQRAAELGLIDMLLPEQAADSALFATALKALPNRMRPSQASTNLHLEGLQNITQSVGTWLTQKSHARLKVVESGF